eukprot:jgi/Mesvir1/24342/Mv11021-RA.1
MLAILRTFKVVQPALLRTASCTMQTSSNFMGGSTGDEVGLLLKATNFAALKHRDQRRKDKTSTPYINHPIGVANLLWDHGVKDIATLQAALLHDVIEDTDCTWAELEDAFGQKVAAIVRDVTDDKSLSKHERKRRQIEHAPTIMPEAKAVKMADKLYNLADIVTNPPPSWSLERCQAYFGWASEVVQGLSGVNPSLESAIQDVLASKLKLPGIDETVPAIREDYKPGDWQSDTPAADAKEEVDAKRKRQ